MPLSFRLSQARAWPTWAALVLTAILGAGCSSDSTRLGQNPFSSPYSARETAGTGEATGSTAQAAPTARVEARPLAAPLPPPPPPPPRLSANTAPEGTVGGGKGLSPYPPNATPEITGSLSPAAPRTPWTRDGGATITVRAGETIDALSRKYGVPAAAIRRANGLSTVSLPRAGQRLVIPRRALAIPAPPLPTPPLDHTAPSTPSAPGGYVHIVAPGETLIKIAKQYHQPLIALARTNHMAPYTKVNLADRLVIPGAQIHAQAPTPPQPQVPPTAPIGKNIPEGDAAPKIKILKEVPDPQTPGNPKSDATGSLPSLRWPVRAKVISPPFGQSPDGQQNDGINLSVPEGTPIKAAEDGVVTYAGNAIKRYGNLVLVKHPNGYSTIYAHLSELLVKRDDTVKRGQVIARSGQSGGVSSPQLHFEVRKGSTPVDPMPFLDRGG
ncbi:MAG: peptidoglycan DD-metalloendopeptidase family protein [Xanthobacteraceae bacterium]